MSKEFFYIVFKRDYDSPTKSVLLFDNYIDFNSLVNSLIKPPLRLNLVSGGRCTISVDGPSVTCYRAPGTVLRPASHDAETIETFLFYGG